MSSLRKLGSDGEDSVSCIIIVKTRIMSCNTFAVFSSSMTTGTMATTLVSTAPVNQVVHPRYNDGQTYGQTDRHV